VRKAHENRRSVFSPALAESGGVAASVCQEWQRERVRERLDWLYQYDASVDRGVIGATHAGGRLKVGSRPNEAAFAPPALTAYITRRKTNHLRLCIPQRPTLCQRTVMARSAISRPRDVETLVLPTSISRAFARPARLSSSAARACSSTTPRARPTSRAWRGLWVHGARLRQTRSWSRPRRRKMRKLSFAHLFTGKEPRPGDRAGRKAQGDRAGADLQGCSSAIRLGGERHAGQARLVSQQRARPADQEEDRQPDQGLSRRHLAAASLTGLARNHRGLRPCRCPGFVHAACRTTIASRKDGESEEAFATRLARSSTR